MPLSKGFLDPKLSIVYKDIRIIFAGLEQTARYFFQNAQKYKSRKDTTPLRDVVLSINVYPNIIRSMKNELPTSTQVCLLLEPSITWPWNGKRDLLDQFEIVLSSAPSQERGDSYIPWYFGELEQIENISPKDWLTRSDTPCLIAANKMSLVKGELYSLRRKVVHCGEPLALGGYGWGSSFTARLVKFFGEILINIRTKTALEPRGLNLFFRKLPTSVTYWSNVPSKYLFAARHKYAIVIENSFELVTEKLYDAIISGNIPIYVGPSYAQSEFPDGLVMFAEPNLASILKGVEEAKSFDHERWLDLREVVLAKLCRRHSMESFLDCVRDIAFGPS